jgi:hypothetical protein
LLIRCAAVGSTVVAVALLPTPAAGIGQRFRGLSQQPRREAISRVFQLTPRHRSARISHEFIHATVGFYSTRLVVPHGLPAELLLQTSIESSTGQPPDVALCTPALFCRSRGVVVHSRCHDRGSTTICEETNPPRAREPIFPPGRFCLLVREFARRNARVSLRAIFIRGFG